MMLRTHILSGLCLSLLAATAPADTYVFTDVTPHVPGQTLIGPAAINNQGDLLFNNLGNSALFVMHRWAIRQITIPGFPYVDGEALLSDGTIAGNVFSKSARGMFTYKPGDLDFLPNPPSPSFGLSGMNDHHDFTLGLKGVSGVGSTAYYFKDGHYHTFQYAGTTLYNLAAISNDGVLLGGLYPPADAFTLRGNQVTQYQVPGFTYTFPVAISPNGKFLLLLAQNSDGTFIIGFVMDSQGNLTELNYPFPTTNAQNYPLDELFMTPTGINDDGVVCGYAQPFYQTGFGETSPGTTSFVAYPQP